jgi:hypothetical protein
VAAREIRLVGVLCVVLTGAFATACSGTRHYDVPPMEGEPASRKEDPYPDFSRPLTSAMPQLSNEESRRMEQQLSALGQQRRNGTISEAEYWRRVRELRALGAATADQQASQ